MSIFSWLFGKKETKKKEVTMGKKLTDSDFNMIALDFELKPAYVRAIFKVEAGGKSGFLKDDPKIPVTLEEGHIFYKYLKEKGYDVEDMCLKYGNICYQKWTKIHYRTGLKEYDRYLQAKKIDEECAMLATSWGLGQIMGFNYKAAGYNTVQDFVNAMYESEKNQLLAMCRFIKSNKAMYTALKNEDWAKFAKLYNGPGYAVNQYDKKLKEAFDLYNKV